MSITDDNYVSPEALNRAWDSYRYDLRGTPKGKTQQWSVERLVLKPGHKRRTRERLKITYCADGWYSRSGEPETPSGDQICNCITERNLYSRYRELHPDPVVWRVYKHDGRWMWRWWRCDAYLPDDIRELTKEALVEQSDNYEEQR